jgi:hypothetical protein
MEEAQMATLTIDGPELVVGLSWLEKIGAGRGNVRVPLRAVRSASAVPDPWAALGGIKLVGTGIRGVASYGTRRAGGGRVFAAVLGGRPAVRVDLGEESPFTRLVVSVRDAGSAVAALRSAAGV